MDSYLEELHNFCTEGRRRSYNRINSSAKQILNLIKDKFIINCIIPSDASAIDMINIITLMIFRQTHNIVHNPKVKCNYIIPL